MTDGTLTQKPKYHCIASEHEGPMRADELRVFYGQLWCSDCWYSHSRVGKRWDELDRFAAVPVAEQEPVYWQYRTWNILEDDWTGWMLLQGERAKEPLLREFISTLEKCDTKHEIRPLYLHPQRAPVAEQHPVAWARMRDGRLDDLFADRKLAEFLSGFAAGKLEPLYLRPQPAPDVAELLEALTPQVLDWMRCGLATNNHLQDGGHPALAKLIAAIAAYRQQGGES